LPGIVPAAQQAVRQTNKQFSIRSESAAYTGACPIPGMRGSNAMNIVKAIAAAGLAAVALTGATAANAQTYRHDRGHHETRWDRHDRGRHIGWNRGHRWGGHRVCRTEWRHHHRVTICR
jgi:hypothetical protein